VLFLRARQCEVPPPPGYSCEQMEGVGNTRCVPQFPVQCQTLLAERLRPIKIVQAHIESRGSNERFCAHRCCHPIAQRQRSLQKIPPLAVVTSHIPELP